MGFKGICTSEGKTGHWVSFEAMLPDLVSLDFEKLPGLDSQLKMAPLNREKEIRSMGAGRNPIHSSVLLLCYPLQSGKTGILLIERQQYPGHHSGQISFPGGRVEASDQGIETTALRETFEETGVNPSDIKLIGKLTPLYIPPSNHLVFPFVGVALEHPLFHADPEEVARILEIPLSSFIDTANLQNEFINLSNGLEVQTPCYVIDGHVVWGATAMILCEFIDMLPTSQT